jgi:hypothetical protein
MHQANHVGLMHVLIIIGVFISIVVVALCVSPQWWCQSFYIIVHSLQDCCVHVCHFQTVSYSGVEHVSCCWIDWNRGSFTLNIS